MARRATPSDDTIYDFADEFLVACPRCGDQAAVRDRGPDAAPRIRLTCAHCGHAEERAHAPSAFVFASDPAAGEPGMAVVGAPVDWHFRLPLWLQAPCCGETLWAYNARHLGAIAAYVAADLRERRRGDAGWRNQSLRSRLPKWVQSAKNRADVLRCVHRLQAKLAAPAA